MQLRYNVPSAGTAAIFAINTGWKDAEHVHGHHLLNPTEAIQKLESTYNGLLEDSARWDYSINARIYGATGGRINLKAFQEMVVTISGCYSALASGATLLKSESLKREANSSPPQEDLS